MDYLSIPQIAAELGISDNTVRRYINRFKDFFQQTDIKNRVKRYAGAMDIIRDINIWYNDQGLNRDTIRANLQKKYAIGDMDTTPNPSDSILDATPHIPHNNDIMAELSRLKKAVEDNTSAIQEMQNMIQTALTASIPAPLPGISNTTLGTPNIVHPDHYPNQHNELGFDELKPLDQGQKYIDILPAKDETKFEPDIKALLKTIYHEEGFPGFSIQAHQLEGIRHIKKSSPGKYSFDLERQPIILENIHLKGYPESAYKKLLGRFSFDIKTRKIAFTGKVITEVVIDYDQFVDHYSKNLDCLKFDYKGIETEEDLKKAATIFFQKIVVTTDMTAIRECPDFDMDLFMRKLETRFISEIISCWKSEPQAQPKTEVDQNADNSIPDCHGKKLSQAERDTIILKVSDLYPGKENSQKRADMLNLAGVPCGRNKTPWTKKKFNDNLRHVKKRQQKALNSGQKISSKKD